MAARISVNIPILCGKWDFLGPQNRGFGGFPGNPEKSRKMAKKRGGSACCQRSSVKLGGQVEPCRRIPYGMGEQLRVSGNSGAPKIPKNGVFCRFFVFLADFRDFSRKPGEAGSRPPHFWLISDKWISRNGGFPDFPENPEKSAKMGKNGEKILDFWKKVSLGDEKVAKNRIFIKPFKK